MNRLICLLFVLLLIYSAEVQGRHFLIETGNICILSNHLQGIPPGEKSNPQMKDELGIQGEDLNAGTDQDYSQISSG